MTPPVDAEAFWLSPASYLLPTHYPASAWVTHAPFAAWVMDVLRPRTVVELGTHFGYSAFAFAEAARRLGVRTEIRALDSWEGDDHAGFYGEEVLGYVRSVVDADYSDVVRLVRGRFSESRPQFQDASVELLHIDGRHAYEDVREDYEAWLSTVRDGGVVLFHDIAERENGFGVWRLWDELAADGRSFSFMHGHGLGVLAVGTGHPAPLAALFAADRNTGDRIRADYGRLGEIVTRQAWLESLPGELEQVWAEVRRRALHEDELAAELADSHTRVAEMENSTSWRLTGPLRVVGRFRP